MVNGEKAIKQTKDHSMRLLTDKFEKEWIAVLDRIEMMQNGAS